MSNNANMEMLGGKAFANMSHYRQLSTLPERAWKYIDERMIAVAKAELVGIADLASSPDTNINFDGTSSSVYLRDRVSEVNEAKMAMSPDTRGESGALLFDEIGVPLPVTYKDFPVEKRQIDSARRADIPFRTTLIEESTRAVSRMLEETLFNGMYTAAGSTIYGYTTFPQRNTYTISTSWATATPTEIFDDVNAMIDLAYGANHYGPFNLYIPREYQVRLNEDYTVGGTPVATNRSIMSRLLELPGLNNIRVSRNLANDNVVLVEMSSSTVQMINGLPMQVIDWEPANSPNWRHTWKVLTIMVPFVYADYDGQCGVVHGSV